MRYNASAPCAHSGEAVLFVIATWFREGIKIKYEVRDKDDAREECVEGQT